MTRVSERMRYSSTENRMHLVKSAVDDAQEAAVSGRKLRSVSADPVATVRVLRNRAKLENVEQFRRTLDFAKGYLSRTEDALKGINEALMRAKELSVQQANGTWDADSRQIVAEEVRNLADEVVQLGNSTFADKYVFAGFRNSEPPVAPNGSFTGDDGVIFVQVDEESFRPVNITGREIFDVPTQGEGKTQPMVKTKRDLYRALNTNDLDLLHDVMGRLDEAASRVVKSTAMLGARQAGIAGLSGRLDMSEERLYADNATLEGIDPMQAAMDLKRAETAVNFTMKSSAEVLQPSLLNFLK